MLEKVSRFTARTASKKHVCSFSDKIIKEGTLYYEITYKTVDGTHETYRVHSTELDNFVHDNCYINVDEKHTTMRKDVDSVHGTLKAFWDKYKDMPAIKEKLNKFKDLLTLPL